MRKLMFLSFLLILVQQYAYASPQSLSYQGRILDSLGSPLENSSVVFRFTLLSPDGTCELWTEDKAPLNMTSSGGIFDLTIGPSAGLATALENGTNHTCLNSGNYTGIATAGRLLKVEFNPGNTGWRVITPNLSVNSVPYASVAAKLGNMTAGDFIARPGTCSTGQSVYFDGTNFVCQSLVAGDIPNIDAAKITSGTLTTNVSSATGQFTNLRIYDGVSQYITMNYPSAGATSYTVRWPATQGAASTVLQNDGAGNLSWAAAGGGSGTVTNVTSANSYITITNNTTTPVITANVGTAANTLAEGNDARITGAVQSAAYNAGLAPAALCTTTQTLYWNTITDQWVCQNINFAGSGAFVNDGNSFGSAATLGTNDNFSLNFETNGATVMSISNSGNVGIGTTSPGARLSVSPGDTAGIIGGRAWMGGWIGGAAEGAFAHSSFSNSTVGYALKQDSVGKTTLNSAGGSPLVFSIDNGISMEFSATGQFGIGVTPTSRLDVDGAITQRGMAAPSAAALGQGRIYFDSTTNKFRASQNGSAYVDLIPAGGSGDILQNGNSFSAPMTIGTNDAQPLSLETSGTEKVRILSNGNVGVGTAAPTETLHISTTDQYGGIRVDRDSNADFATANLRLYSFSNSYQGFGGAVTGVSARGTKALPTATQSGDTLLRVSGNGWGTSSERAGASIGMLANGNWTDSSSPTYMAFSTTAGTGSLNERMRITDAGNVGIGTTNPLSKLDSRSNSGINTIISGGHGASSYGSFVGASSRGTEAAPTASQASDVLGVFGALGYGTSAYPTLSKGGMTVSASQNWTNAAQGTQLNFYTTPNGSNAAQDRLVILNNGNVGIGTVTPTFVLHALRNQNSATYLTVENSNAGASGLAGYVGNSSGGSIAMGSLSSGYGVDGAYLPSGGFVSFSGPSGLALVSQAPAGNFRFYTAGAAAGDEKMRISSNGNVGIGNTAPGRLLHVGSASVVTGLAVANFQNVDGTCTITPASSGSGIACSSDERLKENFKEIKGQFALDRILKLQAVTYNFKTSSIDNRRTGYKAQEVQKVAPEFVRENDDGLLQVYYDAFIPWITEAIKTLHSRITGVENHQVAQDREIASVKTQKADKTEFDAKVQQLESENNKLKQENAAIKEYLCAKDPKAAICK